jgi:hypothetical protein
MASQSMMFLRYDRGSSLNLRFDERRSGFIGMYFRSVSSKTDIFTLYISSVLIVLDNALRIARSLLTWA